MRIIDRQNPRKLYLQLVDILYDAIERNELKVGEQLPTEDLLCKQQGVSKSVVRTAMQEMVRKGYVRKIPGKGTFVQKPVEAEGVWLSTLMTEKILDYGSEWETEVIQKMSTSPPLDLNEFFSVEIKNQVFKIVRLRSINESPVVLETAYVSNDLCPGLPIEDLRASSLFDLIAVKNQIPITRCADSIEITTLEEREAALLKVEEESPALLLDRILYTSNNRVVAFLRILSVSENHRITFELVRNG